MKKICGIYKITNKLTGECYIGSSKDVKQRWRSHKAPSEHRRKSNKLYQDMDEIGIDSFEFEILEEVNPEELRIREDEYIRNLSPAYNTNFAVLDVEKRKASHKSALKVYYNQPCNYNGEILTLNALSLRFKRLGIPHPKIEAHKYIIAS